MNDTTRRLLALALLGMAVRAVTANDDGTLSVTYAPADTPEPTGKVCAWCGVTPVTDRRARCEKCRGN